MKNPEVEVSCDNSGNVQVSVTVYTDSGFRMSYYGHGMSIFSALMEACLHYIRNEDYK